MSFLYTTIHSKKQQSAEMSFHHLWHKVTRVNSTSFRINSTQLPFVITNSTAKENNAKLETSK